jgi:hypothetical protein
MNLGRSFCGAVFALSFVRINLEALQALDKFARPNSAIFGLGDFDLTNTDPLQDMVVLNAPEFEAYLELIPLHNRSLAKIDFDKAPHSKALVIQDNSLKSLARLIKHAATADFFEKFKSSGMEIPHQTLAMYLFWELNVAGGQGLNVNNPKFLKTLSWIPSAKSAFNAPSMIFADSKGRAGEILEGLSSAESAAVIIGQIDINEWIMANEFAKKFLSMNLKESNKIAKGLIAGWIDEH